MCRGFGGKNQTGCTKCLFYSFVVSWVALMVINWVRFYLTLEHHRTISGSTYYESMSG